MNKRQLKASRKLMQRPFSNATAVRGLYASYVWQARMAYCTLRFSLSTPSAKAGAALQARDAIQAARELRLAVEAGYV